MKRFILWWAVVFFIPSCDLFKTRDPESPDQQSSTFSPPVVDTLVFVNLTNAIRELNAVNYARCFADSTTTPESFRFEPTSQANSRYGGVFLAWTKESEKDYFNRMRQSVSAAGGAATLEFLSLTLQSRQADSSQYSSTYRLTVQHSQSNIAKQVKGQSQFYLIKDQFANWAIRRWVDIALNSSDSTWSDVKGGFSQ